MPYLGKEALSQYIRTACKRQLRLYLTPDNAQYAAERAAHHMPPPQPPRPGLEYIKQEGDRWQAEKLHDLTQAFGVSAVIGDSFLHSSGQIRYREQSLQHLLRQPMVPYTFLIEAEFEIDATFKTALGISGYETTFNLRYANVRPDVIQIFPPSHFHTYVLPSGEIDQLPPGDPRLQLRVIDIKLTAEPSPSYFAEVTYYMVALAGWLIDHHLDHQFVVVPDGAIWPGTHAASHLMKTLNNHPRGSTPSPLELQEALEHDLEIVPFEVFAFRLRRFLQEDVQEVLATPSWQTLEWHVDNRCKGCEYAGYPWQNSQGQLTSQPAHCMPTAAQQDHLCRVAFIPRGASIVLRNQGVQNVSSLASRQPHDAVYDLHQALRATRTVVSSRAQALQTGLASLSPGSGTSAIMPRWADLRMYLSVDFDLGSAITFAFGLKASWVEPFDRQNPAAPRRTQRWQPLTLVVDQRDLQAEQRELLAFLKTINDILTEAKQQLHPDTSVQFYLWDRLQYDHFTRIIGRHLQAVLQDRTIHDLAWLFPSEELLPNYAMITRRSPLTLVREVVRSLLAAPIPYYYSLLEVARIYHQPHLPPNIAQFNVHPLFEDMLSDQIPSERAHEIWSRTTSPRHWQQQMRTLEETIKKKLDALETVTQQLETDLRVTLQQSAPPIHIGPPRRENRLSTDSQLWYAFAKLNDALEELDIQQIRAMPPHEREARFHSARLIRRLTGNDERQALATLNLPSLRGRRVYEINPGSQEVKMRDGDFSFALAPEAQSGFLDRLLQGIVQGTPLQLSTADWNTRMEDVTGVTIVALDRDHRWIVLDPNRRWPTMIDDLEAHGIVNFSRDVVLDPVHHDYFTKKLLAALRAIGNPALARNNSLVRQATGQSTGHGAHQTRHTPPADVLWDAQTMYATPVARHLAPVRAALHGAGIDLNPTQWNAWQEALSRRLQLIWGPPGTGKSRTAKVVVVGAALEAYQQQKPLRFLICASTYTALDNVLLGVYQDVQALLPSATFTCHRLRSYLQPVGGGIPPQIDRELNKHHPSQQVVDLRSCLKNAQGITIVGATPEQVHNLLVINGNPAQDELFDFILIDEASQMDVGHAILALSSLSTNGSVVLAGDPKQLPPIHQAEAPLGLETMVGSIYAFCEEFHHVSPLMLQDNYRSNATLVNFSLNAGYRAGLTSFSPNLRLNLQTPFPPVQPAHWPSSLYWTPEWTAFLDPDHPATCFVYPEGHSSQWNRFEADAVASLIYLLHGRMANQLLCENDPTTGNPILITSSTVCAPTDFWQRSVGIVTPHRAQQGLIVSQLQRLFAPTGVSPSLIRDAVDTVERFQGQQRDIIIASFALGDPDAIQNEDEFLMSLNRFNVMASRARAKLILFVSRQVVDHLPDDLDILRESRLLKLYVDSFCNNARPISLGFLENGVVQPVIGHFKWRC